MIKRIHCTLAATALLLAASALGDTVTTSRYRIKVDGNRYIMRGICYHPVPKGQNKRSFETLAQDLELMQEAGINTIRVYAPIDDKGVLDKINAAGIKVIIGFGYNQGGLYDMLSGSFIDYVKKYKDHPAILMWELGNEYNYHPEWFEGDLDNWYEALNEAAKLIHQIDKNHPTSSAHGELPDQDVLSSCKNIDVWGINAYRWDHLKSGGDEGETIFEQWSALSSKPMYLSEAGADSYMSITSHGYKKGENQQAQADANKNILQTVFSNDKVCSGVTLFSFSDGWWKAGNPCVQDTGGSAPNSSGVPYDGAPNEEYWGIVDIDRNKKATFPVVKAAYSEAARKR
ncbi:glycoside hydrolase family 2 TIM barrel-domain containing protein [Pontiella sp.]|uniref:glycoside hydrolase family 2 TIM barrel-domain containing protein n=1 Tax=Pontiella sp. TaxID=2837462 RepID=UPI0035674702